MENKTNIAELLKNCPKGMELDCSIWDNVVFDHIDTTSNYPIYIKKMGGELEYLTEDGHFNFDCDAKCVIFPKGKTTWEDFIPPYEFNDGDVVATNSGCFIGIIEIKNNMQVGTYCAIDYRDDFQVNPDYVFSRLATEEEKKKLFDAIKDNDYRWNPETKTLEKLPKFKVGDKVKRKDVDYTYIVTIAKLDDDYYDYVNEDGQCGVIHISTQDEWELVPNKFDITALIPFEKVLVRHNKDNKWCGSFFSHIDGDFHSHCYKFVTIAGKSYPMCIPYEGNEHLRGTTDDCDEYYKN